LDEAEILHDADDFTGTMAKLRKAEALAIPATTDSDKSMHKEAKDLLKHL